MSAGQNASMSWMEVAHNHSCAATCTCSLLSACVVPALPCRQPCARLVTDIALANKQAWQFFTAMGFTRGAASGQTAEAWLALEPGSNDAPAASALPPAAASAASAGSCRFGSNPGRHTLAGCGTTGALHAMQLPRRPVVQHILRPAVLQRGLYQTVHRRGQVSGAMARVRAGMVTC
jgi:hypothetical protein